MKAQVLDDMDLEREKGITIKSHAIAMAYRSKNGRAYELNLINTPGHVDFTYEVSRALAACEGAILVVDASQGIEAQTLSNYFLAKDQHLAIADVPPPSGDPDAPFRARIFDSKFDQYRGVVCLVRVVDGSVRAGDQIQFLSNGVRHEVAEVGKLRLKLDAEPELHAGQVG